MGKIRMMKFLNLISLVGLLLVGIAHASPLEPVSEGLPLPLPMPWAKDCEVSWENVAGRYSLMDAGKRSITLKITVVKGGPVVDMVRVSSYSKEGTLTLDGFSLMHPAQKTMNVDLTPKQWGDENTHVEIRLYRTDAQSKSCDDTGLVPIMVWNHPGLPDSTPIYFVLKKGKLN
jgi:hypothetical protein